MLGWISTHARLPLGLLAGLAVFWLVGCTRWSMPGLVRTPADLAADKQHAAASAAQDAENIPALTQAVWIRTLPSTISAAGLRWRSPAMDELLAAPRERQPDFQASLASKQPIIAANAAIALARLGSGAGTEQLLVAARATQLQLPLRRAAIEALSLVDEPAALAGLKELGEQYGRFGPDHPGYIPELHAELLYALARRVDPAEQPMFTAAVRSPAVEVRQAALEAWAKSKGDGLPTTVADLRGDPNARVRSMAMAALAATHDRHAAQYATLALSDDALEVRLSAIAALGDAGGDEARAAVEKQLKNDSDLIRAAAVASLAKLGATELVRSAADDKSWHVRLAVVQQLSGPPDPQTIELMEQFLEDRSSEVERAAVACLENWPLETAGPLLLTALHGRSYLLRKDAGELLAKRWPPAHEFQADLPPDRREAVLASLAGAWYAEHPAPSRIGTNGGAGDKPKKNVPTIDENAARGALAVLARHDATPDERAKACAELKQIGPGLLAWLESLPSEGAEPLPAAIYHDLLPEMGIEFALAQQLDSRDVDQRRRVADRLARQAADEPLRPLLVRWIADCGMVESDALVSRSLLATLVKDSSQPARRLAAAAASHPSPEIRRLACEYFVDHPDRANADVLLPALSDTYTPVVMAAAKALGQPGVLTNPAPLEQLLSSSDRLLRLEAAVSLARIKAPSGRVALERLARDEDAEMRRRTADAMGRLADPAYTACLVALLDDRSEARRAALENLPRVVGHDVAAESGKDGLSSVEKIDLWKQWWQREQIHSEPDARVEQVDQ